MTFSFMEDDFFFPVDEKVIKQNKNKYIVRFSCRRFLELPAWGYLCWTPEKLDSLKGHFRLCHHFDWWGFDLWETHKSWGDCSADSVPCPLLCFRVLKMKGPMSIWHYLYTAVLNSREWGRAAAGYRPKLELRSLHCQDQWGSRGTALHHNVIIYPSNRPSLYKIKMFMNIL